MKLTKFEVEELRYKISVLIDSGEEMFADIGHGEAELESLSQKVISTSEVVFEEWEHALLKEEAENLLDIAECNLDAGFPEYKNDVRKLRILVTKFEAA